jgi:hypothetical protein
LYYEPIKHSARVEDCTDLRDILLKNISVRLAMMYLFHRASDKDDKKWHIDPQSIVAATWTDERGGVELSLQAEPYESPNVPQRSASTVNTKLILSTGAVPHEENDSDSETRPESPIISLTRGMQRTKLNARNPTIDHSLLGPLQSSTRSTGPTTRSQTKPTGRSSANGSGVCPGS